MSFYGWDKKNLHSVDSVSYKSPKKNLKSHPSFSFIVYTILYSLES